MFESDDTMWISWFGALILYLYAAIAVQGLYPSKNVWLTEIDTQYNIAERAAHASRARPAMQAIQSDDVIRIGK
jgi:hypothetical protein